MRFGKTVEAKMTRAAKKAGILGFFFGTPDEIQVQVNRWYASLPTSVRNRYRY